MRKSLLLVFIALFISTLSYSQITKGSTLLGGSLSFSSQSSKSPSAAKNNQSAFNILPVLGKAVKENLIIGGFLSFGCSQNDSYAAPGAKHKSKNYGVGAFIRKYKPIKNSGFYLFLEAGLIGSAPK